MGQIITLNCFDFFNLSICSNYGVEYAMKHEGVSSFQWRRPCFGQISLEFVSWSKFIKKNNDLFEKNWCIKNIINGLAFKASSVHIYWSFEPFTIIRLILFRIIWYIIKWFKWWWVFWNYIVCYLWNWFIIVEWLILDN